MSEKIVVLNSGGFDSVVLMNVIRHTYPDTEIHSLHFRYGARNEEQQLRCVEKVCEKVGAVSTVIDLPKFMWTSNNFYKEDNVYETQYLEYRNLVFLSYAISYAESIGAKEIYLATYQPNEVGYNDNNDIFYKGLNSFTTKNSGIEIKTPFWNIKDKLDLLSLAISNGVFPDDYFSCDTPKENGEPCGECFDCLSLKDIEDSLKLDHPMKAFYQGGYKFDNEVFKTLLADQKPTEVRALINNECQLKCSHCFYGFEKMKREQLSKEEYYSVLKDFVLNYGIQNIHFSGKEPLFDDTLLWYAEQIKKDNLPCTFNLVTNGINVPKYAERLKELGIERIYLSVDDVLDTNGVRSVHHTTDKALEVCKSLGIKIEVFIDLHYHNFNRLSEIIGYIEENYCVQSYHIRTIRSIGKATDQKLLTGKELDIVWNDLKEIAEKYEEKSFALSISNEYVNELQGTNLLNDIDLCESLYTDCFTENLCLMLEEYCSRYSVSYTLTPDGFLLGCASEVSLPDYDKYSVGNVKDTSLKELVRRGNEISYSCNDCYIGNKICCSCNYLKKLGELP